MPVALNTQTNIIVHGMRGWLLSPSKLLSTIFCFPGSTYYLLSIFYLLYSLCLLSSTFYLLSSIFDLLSSIFYLLSSTFCLLSSIFDLLSSIFDFLCKFLDLDIHDDSTTVKCVCSAKNVGGADWIGDTNISKIFSRKNNRFSTTCLVS